ncbi:MAG: DUF4214 domain-containing protein [Betaproteobacteria bacterium]|nr:DUF4214 domain-containing protein [Betaproteobacteria bacterium]
MPSGDYVLNLYKNTLGRNPLDTNPVTGLPYDAPGYEYWKSVLDAGFTTRQNMFVFFSESTENRNAVAELIGQGIGPMQACRVARQLVALACGQGLRQFHHGVAAHGNAHFVQRVQQLPGQRAAARAKFPDLVATRGL